MASDNSLPTSDNVTSIPPPAVFSSDNLPTSSPPSSPPGFPWDYDDTRSTKPTAPVQRTAFTLLGKKRKALSPITDNAPPVKKPATSATTGKRQPTLAQAQLSLGQTVQKRCKTCGMAYIASSLEDRRLHDRYHKQTTEGYDLGRDFVRAGRKGTVVEGTRAGDAICIVVGDEKPGSSSRRRKAEAVLDVVQEELGAVGVDLRRGGEGRGEETKRRVKGRDGGGAAGDGERNSRWRHYLYVRGGQCIAYLLTERIQHARTVLASTNSEEANMELSPTTTEASLGISRIWTLSAHRGEGLATALLDAALEVRDGQDQRLEKDMVAFSQPTTSGTRLARKWFGREDGWKVYVD